jgi:hypothetical protein
MKETPMNKPLMTAALAGLMLAATVSISTADDNKKGDSPGDVDPKAMGECHGVNSCKGTGACHGAGNTCAGQNACKGKGWIKATKADCDKQQGTFKLG